MKSANSSSSARGSVPAGPRGPPGGRGRSSSSSSSKMSPRPRGLTSRSSLCPRFKRFSLGCANVSEVVTVLGACSYLTRFSSFKFGVGFSNEVKVFFVQASFFFVQASFFFVSFFPSALLSLLSSSCALLGFLFIFNNEALPYLAMSDSLVSLHLFSASGAQQYLPAWLPLHHRHPRPPH